MRAAGADHTCQAHPDVALRRGDRAGHSPAEKRSAGAARRGPAGLARCHAAPGLWPSRGPAREEKCRGGPAASAYDGGRDSLALLPRGGWDGPAGMTEEPAHPEEDAPAHTGIALRRPRSVGMLLRGPELARYGRNRPKLE
jgi:hypothetical protein